MQLSLKNVSRFEGLDAIRKKTSCVLNVMKENVNASNELTDDARKSLSNTVAFLSGQYVTKKASTVSSNNSKVEELAKQGKLPSKPHKPMVGRLMDPKYGSSKKDLEMLELERKFVQINYDNKMSDYINKLSELGITPEDVDNYFQKINNNNKSICKYDPTYKSRIMEGKLV